MKNIEAKAIMQLRNWVGDYKKYKSLYDTAVETFAEVDSYPADDIIKIIKESMETELDSIGAALGDLYDDWSGKNGLKGDMDDYDYWEAADEIDQKHEDIAGLCEYIVCVPDELYVGLYTIPVDFMEEFIAEYGIFQLDEYNNVCIV